MQNKKLAIIGTVGVPASYGGFETLADNLVKYHSSASLPVSLTVYCSSKSYPARTPVYLSARLRYVPFNANGAQSIAYDVWSLISAAWSGSEVILLLGVSGAIALPLARLFSQARIITNIDGLEWRRDKWQGLARHFLRFSERMAVRHSHDVIADNTAIAEYVAGSYGVKSHVIAYGGDHATAVDEVAVDEYALPVSYAFSVCRIEPENNVHLIVEAFSRQEAVALVMIGNWDGSEYGRMIRRRYAGIGHLYLMDALYDLGKLKALRSKALFYVHGHSAGGTNPSLVEAMHFGKPILAFDCNYNRSTTENQALYFGSGEELLQLIKDFDAEGTAGVAQHMAEIARRRYTWDIVARQYFELMGFR